MVLDVDVGAFIRAAGLQGDVVEGHKLIGEGALGMGKRKVPNKSELDKSLEVDAKLPKLDPARAIAAHQELQQEIAAGKKVCPV